MALRLITCSPRRTALLPPLRPERLLPPGALTPAPRRQDHTSLPYALMPFAIGTASVHRDPPHDRGDRERPSGRDGMAIDMPLIWPSDKAKYFLFQGLTPIPKIGICDLPVGSFGRGQPQLEYLTQRGADPRRAPDTRALQPRSSVAASASTAPRPSL